MFIGKVKQLVGSVTCNRNQTEHDTHLLLQLLHKHEL